MAGFGRWARCRDAQCATAARYLRWPPLPATSRDTLDAARPSRCAIPRSDSSAANPREISSRSQSDNRCGDHCAAGNGRRNPAVTTWVRIVDGDRPDRRLIDRNDSHASSRSHSSVFSNSDDRRITHLHNQTLHSRRRCCNDPLTSLPSWRLGRSGLVHATKQFSTSHRDPLTVTFAMGFLEGLNRSSTCMIVW